MKIIPVICTQCDAPLTIEEGSSMAKCQFCGCSFMISQDDGRVGASKSDQLIRNGRVAFNKLKDYTRAFKYYEEAANENASDFRGYAGMLYATCAQYEENFPRMDVFDNMRKYKNNALMFANDEQDAQINGYWHSYVTDLKKRRDAALHGNQNACDANEMLSKQTISLMERLQEDLRATDSRIAELQKKHRSLEKLHKQKWYLLVVLLWTLIVFVLSLSTCNPFGVVCSVLLCIIVMLVPYVIIKIIEKAIIKSNEKQQDQMHEHVGKISTDINDSGNSLAFYSKQITEAERACEELVKYVYVE